MATITQEYYVLARLTEKGTLSYGLYLTDMKEYDDYFCIGKKSFEIADVDEEEVILEIYKNLNRTRSKLLQSPEEQVNDINDKISALAALIKEVDNVNAA